MKWLRENWFMLLLIAIIAILISIITCNKPTDHTNEKAQIDSLKKVISQNNTSTANYMDSLSKVNDTLYLKVDKLLPERDSLKIALLKLKNKAPAIIKGDTLIAESCDSILLDYANYRELSEKIVSDDDSIISNQSVIIANLDSSNKALSKFNIDLKTSFEAASKNYDKLFKDYNKQLKKQKWFKVKEKGLIIILLGLTGAYLAK